MVWNDVDATRLGRSAVDFPGIDTVIFNFPHPGKAVQPG